MTLNEIQKASLETDKPVIEVIYKTDTSKVLAIGLKKGVVFPEHTAPSKAKLMVIEGEVDFNTATESYRLAMSDCFDIPLDTPHSVVGFNNALFLVLFENY